METEKGWIITINPTYGLNRTMQYGNPLSGFGECLNHLSLNRTMQYGNLLRVHSFQLSMLFKSYYVVWKPSVVQQVSSSSPCLNRTMQYGNYILSPRALYSFCMFKSYYVVWKPLTFFVIFFFVFSLNRTMQYGNFLLVVFLFFSCSV